jgi:RNA polymerase sigma-70 factor (ECF subfamily)
MTAERDSRGGTDAPDATDAELVRRCRAGDAAAFDALVRRHYRAAHAVAYAVMRNAMDAEDVVQDAFVKALEKLDDCRDGATFGPWLRQIVRRRALNAQDARRVRDVESLAPEIAAGTDDPLRDVENAELGERLTTALNTLTEIQRAVLLLHEVDGRSHGEIAAIVGCSPGMSQQHLFTARKKLRRLLGDTRDA